MGLKNRKYFNVFALAIVAFVFTVSVYLINKVEYSRGGLGADSINFLKIDLPIIMIVFISMISILKTELISFLLIYIPIVLFYIMFNEYYIFFDRILRLTEINELSELMSVLTWWHLSLLGLFIVI